jgi:hypothetical protein
MPEIKTEQATLIAMQFLERAGHYFREARKTKRSDGGWTVEVAVGLFSDRIAKVEIAPNGEIQSLEVVPSE